MTSTTTVQKTTTIKNSSKEIIQTNKSTKEIFDEAKENCMRLKWHWSCHHNDYGGIMVSWPRDKQRQTEISGRRYVVYRQMTVIDGEITKEWICIRGKDPAEDLTLCQKIRDYQQRYSSFN